jgi:multidrug efflux pump subunit AcrB/ABC-type multidrug transport system ATPase subunit
MLLIGLCLLGAVSYTRLQVELIPYTELPMLIVQVGSAREADPHYVEQEAIIPLENAIAGLEDIERIESYIGNRQATILVYYTTDANSKYAYLKLQECVDASRSQLGDGFFAMVWKIDTEQLANQFMSLQARGESGLDQIREVVDRKVVPELEQIDGIANIEVYGGRQHSVEVVLDEDALRSHNLTASQVSSRISGGSGARTYLGQVTDGRKTYFVNLVADYTALSELENVIVKDQGPVLLRHVGAVVDGGTDETSISRINGMESISISIIRDQQSNLLSLSSEAQDVIETINERIASDGVELVISYDAAEAIRDNIDIIKMLALVGGILAVFVLWIFLRNLPLVLIVATAIPISVLIALNLFYAFDISLNTLTLVGLAIAIGMLLDNSVVVLENIHRHISRGVPVRQAVIDGTGEVWRPVAATTLTTVCIFVPFIFSDNFLVQTLGRHVGISIISTLLVSLAVAFLLIPAFTYRILSRQSDFNNRAFARLAQTNRQMQIYTLLLKSCLRFPARTVIVGIVVFFVSVLICLAVSINVAEEVELGTIDIYTTMPSGTTLETADEQVRKIDERLIEFEEIEERRATIEEDNVSLSLTLKDDFEDVEGRDFNTLKNEIVDDLDGAFPRVDFSFEPPASNMRYRGGGGGGMGGSMGRSFERLLGIGSSEERVLVRGQDLATLLTIADDIQYNIDNLESIYTSHLSVMKRQPSIDLMFDRTVLSFFGVTTNDLQAQLAGFQGESSTGASFKQGTDEIDIILKSSDTTEPIAEDLRQVQIPSSGGGTIPLMQLAQMIYTDGYSNINRVNQEKVVEISYRFSEEVQSSNDLLTAARAEIDDLATDIIPPPGVIIEVEHDETDLSDFYFLIFAAVILIYMILASVFESLITPLAMMFTLPLATIGAFWGLILTGNSLFDANALIGFLILLGVVVNNGIILIDYYRLLHTRGYRQSRALLMAGQARVRPILITATTTILAMLPLAMGKAEYVARIGSPFAITVIGGLVAGTVFTLLLVPTVAFGMETVLRWWYRLNWKIKVLQVATLVGGMTAIYYNVDSFLWQAANATALILLVPGLTYFIMISLRRSSAKAVPEGETIRIRVRNVVKLYDDYSRFVREWRGGRRLRDRLRREGRLPGRGGAISIVGQLPFYIFHFYYAYMYLESGFWILVFTVAFHMYSVRLFRRYLIGDNDYEIIRWKKIRKLAFVLMYWFVPMGNLVWYGMTWAGIALAIIIGLFWMLALAVNTASRKLYREQIDINRLKGRFRRIRKLFYRFVKIIPLIGKKKTPFRAVNRISLEIGSGMFGLVGPNGAGKTTLMRIICGILQQSAGKVTINDIDVDEKREELQALIGYLPQEFGTYQNMTAYQFLDYQALLKGLWDDDNRKQTVERAIKAVHLEASRNVKIKAFSGGMKQRVGIAQTLLHLPRILIVDEPTAGLDPRERIKFRNLLSDLARDRVVIFSTHIIEDVSSSCNRLAVLGDGQVKFLGAPAEMVELTRGYVWQVNVTDEEYERIRSETRIVHHMRDGDRIRIRVLAKTKPLPEAVTVTPTLEDSYLWLLDEKEAA